MNKFKQFMEKHRLKQKELAELLGVNQSLISQWCTGRCKPNILQVDKIARYTKVSTKTVIECFK